MLERGNSFPRGTGIDGMLSLLGNKNYPTVRGVRKLSDLPGVVNNEITLDPCDRDWETVSSL